MRPSTLLCLLALPLFSCQDHNGETCPGRTHICALRFDAPDACGKYLPSPKEVGGTDEAGPTAWRDSEGVCWIWVGTNAPLSWQPAAPDDWCNLDLLEAAGYCRDEEQGW